MSARGLVPDVPSDSEAPVLRAIHPDVRIEVIGWLVDRDNLRNDLIELWQKLDPTPVEMTQEQGLLELRQLQRRLLVAHCGPRGSTTTMIGAQWRRAARQAFGRGHGFSLTLAEFAALHTHPCYRCGSDNLGGGVGLDRVNSQGGYHLGNVLPCCGPCNVARGRSAVPGLSDMAQGVADAVRRAVRAST
jgi:hypothetical protein